MMLRPMSDEEFRAWNDRAVESYAQDTARASGRPFEAARERATAQFTQFLPDGQRTPNTWLMTVCDDNGAAVGRLWVGPHPERSDLAYVFDIEIDESRRGEGLGRAAMIATEQLVRDAGIHEIGLNVFGFNEPAHRLYTSLGYRVVATQMAKPLS